MEFVTWLSHETGIVEHLCDDLYLCLFVIGNLQPVVERLNHLNTDLLPFHLTDVVVRLLKDLKRNRQSFIDYSNYNRARLADS